MKENILLISSAVINVFMIGYLFNMFRNIRTYFWPVTKGIIIRSEIDISEDSEGGEFYGVLIEYKYSVNNVKYQSDHVTFALNDSGNRKHSEKFVTKFPENKIVNVSYNPKDHKSAILQPGFRAHQFYLLFFLLFCFYIWVPIGWLAWAWAWAWTQSQVLALWF